jgi:Protein of unknown function (DUF2911)
MRRCPRRLSSQASISLVAIAFAGLVLPAATQQAPPGTDGLVRSELSLGGRTATLAYSSELHASDPAHEPLLSAATTDVRVRVAELYTTGDLRIGAVDVPGPDAAARPTPQGPAAAGYELWLATASGGWRLEIVSGDRVIGAADTLARAPLTPAAPRFVAALVPEAGAAGRIALRWGGYQASAPVQFLNPLRRRTDENRVPNVTTNRAHDEDTSALSRARLLAQRNETAFVRSNGQRVSVSFQRTFAKGERPAGSVDSRGLGVEGPDFARLMQTADGAVVMLTEASVPRLRTETTLRFGGTTVATGNQSAGFPGSYGLWLKRAGDGWRLIFNHEPDAWGSQHNPKFDAGDAPLTYSGGHAASRPFAVALVPTSLDGGRLAIIWGPHEWTAEFTLAD